MKFIFLYGAPAVGKLTVARELANLTGYRLFHNHLTVDLGLAVYDFGTPGFIALREKVWLLVIRHALADRLKGLIFTFNPESSVPQRFIDDLFTEIVAQGAELITVELTASEAAIESRLGSESRQNFNKLVDLDLYKKFRAAGAFLTPVIPPPNLTINTEKARPHAAAQQINAYLNSK